MQAPQRKTTKAAEREAQIIRTFLPSSKTHHAPTPGYVENEPKKQDNRKEMKVSEALEKEWSYASIDKAVKMRLVELFTKAGQLYLRVL